MTKELNCSLERTRTSRSDRFESVAQWRLVRAAQTHPWASEASPDPSPGRAIEAALRGSRKANEPREPKSGFRLCNRASAGIAGLVVNLYRT